MIFVKATHVLGGAFLQFLRAARVKKKSAQPKFVSTPVMEMLVSIILP